MILAGLSSAVVVLGLVLWLRGPQRSSAPNEEPRAWVTLREPRGDVGSAPERFVWAAVEGAAAYRVTIADADAMWPLFVRTTQDTALPLTDREAQAIVPGRIHTWEVEALDAAGAAIAKGGVRFRVVPNGEMPS